MAGVRWPFWLFIVVLTLVYYTLTLVFGLGRLAPDLLTVAVLLGSRRLSAAGGAALGFVLGLTRDALSLVAFGASTLSLTLIGFLGARSKDLFVGDSLLFIGVYLFVGKLLQDAVFYLLARSAFREAPVEFLLMEAPLAALYTAGVGVAALLVYRMVAAEP
jgi:rod shape-determining protein MreD